VQFVGGRADLVRCKAPLRLGKQYSAREAELTLPSLALAAVDNSRRRFFLHCVSSGSGDRTSMRYGAAHAL